MGTGTPGNIVLSVSLWIHDAIPFKEILAGHFEALVRSLGKDHSEYPLNSDIIIQYLCISHSNK